MLELSPHSLMEKRRVGLKAAHHFFFVPFSYFLEDGSSVQPFVKGNYRFFFFVCVCVSSQLLSLILENKKRMYDLSQSPTLCLIQLCLFISLWGGWVGGWGRSNGWEGMD